MSSPSAPVVLTEKDRECSCSAGHIYDPVKLDAERRAAALLARQAKKAAAAAAGTAAADDAADEEVEDGPISPTNDSGFVPAIAIHPAVAPHVESMRAYREHFHRTPEISFQACLTQTLILQSPMLLKLFMKI